ncbi:hypothetical protein I6F14_10135 [Bradyrhizobium sp. IC3069]|nr:hypothetical protein [Bradyrhizobium sp. IC3069]
MARLSWIKIAHAGLSFVKVHSAISRSSLVLVSEHLRSSQRAAVTCRTRFSLVEQEAPSRSYSSIDFISSRPLGADLHKLGIERPTGFFLHTPWPPPRMSRAEEGYDEP